MQSEWSTFRRSEKRIAFVIIAFVGLAVVFLLQDFDWLGLTGLERHPYLHFAVKKIARLTLNDLCMVLLIHAWFNQKQITTVAWKLQIVDTFILLPLYLVLKLGIEGHSEISSPLLSQFHRLIVNPTIIILLIPGVYFQRATTGNKWAQKS